jgi:hypothetical protein
MEGRPRNGAERSGPHGYRQKQYAAYMALGTEKYRQCSTTGLAAEIKPIQDQDKILTPSPAFDSIVELLQSNLHGQRAIAQLVSVHVWGAWGPGFEFR